MSDAKIRYFCLALPNGGASLGYDYLEAFDKTELGVRACPIGPAFLMAAPWVKLTHLFFVGQNIKSFTNVVCAPPNLLMGQALKMIDVRPPSSIDVAFDTTVLAENPLLKPDKSEAIRAQEVVYKPQTAFSGLFTVGVKNIAITMPKPKPPDAHEVKALQQYDIVLAPTDADVEGLRVVGVTALHVPADKDQLARVVSMLG